MKHEGLVIVAIGLLTSTVLAPVDADAQACPKSGGEPFSICTSGGVPCSPPTGGSCKQLAVGCRCRSNSAATPEAVKCQRIIGKAYSKFAYGATKAHLKCEEAELLGTTCDLAAIEAKIDAEADKARTKAEKACTGVDFAGLGAGSCAVNPDGSTNPLEQTINCLEAAHRSGAASLVTSQYGSE
jgi:hypothetical protein